MTNRLPLAVFIVGLVCLLGGIAWLSVPWAFIIGGTIAIASVTWDDGK